MIGELDICNDGYPPPLRIFKEGNRVWDARILYDQFSIIQQAGRVVAIHYLDAPALERLSDLFIRDDFICRQCDVCTE